MLTAIVLGESDQNQKLAHRVPEQAARTLAFLVSAAVQGLIRDAVLIGEETPALRYVADYAGCTLVGESDPAKALAKALDLARGEHVFLLRAGYAAEPPLIDEIRDFLELGPSGQGACGLVREMADGFMQRIWPAMSPLAGLVAPWNRSRAARPRDLQHLARTLRPRVTLKTGARRILY
jgi:hypothetical protein